MKNNVLSVLFGSNNKAKAEATGIAAQHSIAEITWAEGGWSTAGYLPTGEYRILSRKTGLVVDLRPKQLDEATLRAFIGNSYCNDNYSEEDPKSKKVVFKAELLAEEIRTACDDFGLANPSAVRGPGLYVDAGSRLTVNYGNAVYDQAGNAVSTRPERGQVYVAGQSLGFGPETPCASNEDIAELEAVYGSFNFEQSYAASVSMGWMASSFFGSVLPNSPSIFLSAEKGSGKTTWVELQQGLLGPQAFRRDGVPTVAQVIYALQNSSAALLLDEYQPQKASKKQNGDLWELFNTGFTNARAGRITRVIAGQMRSFNPPAGVALCGIDLPAFEDALESRGVRLRMAPLSRGEQSKSPLLDSVNREAVEAMGARVRRLLVTRWPVMSETRVAVHKLLLEIGHSNRAADRLSPLLAGYVALKQAVMPTREALVELIARWELNEVKANETESTRDACLNVLLDRKVALFLDRGGKPVKVHERVRDAIRLLASCKGDREARRPLEKQLEMLGLKPIYQTDSDTWRLAVASSEHNLGLRRMFQGTPWAAGSWADVLARLPGATKTNQRLAGDSVKVVVVHLPASVVQPVFDEEDGSAAGIAPETDAIRTVRGEWLD